MQELLCGMRYLCDESRMLAGITVAYGTPSRFESASHGHAQEVCLGQNDFEPCVRPLARDTLYDLASLTKLFTAVLAMMLVREGRLSLDAYVGELDPRFSHLRHVRVGDVLGFTVSLQTPGRIDGTSDREEGLRRLFGVAPCPTPAVRVYSDINAMVIKYVIEAASGMAFADALAQRVFSPIGLESTFAHMPREARSRCACYNYEHRIDGERFILRTDTPPGAPHDPKALLLSQDGRDLCGHAGLFSTCQDMVRFAQALLAGELIPRDTLLEIGKNRTGKPNGDGTYRQYLGCLCFTKHPLQRLSEVPAWMGEGSIGLSGFTGNHLSIDPIRARFVLFLGNRCHARVSHIALPDGRDLQSYGPDAQGVGPVRWDDGRHVPSSARYVYFKDARLHEPIAARMRRLGWL